ncbi:MAG: response regulator transcription factor [Bacillota bacterium]|nr:response regulator transcription factor [Bacillota bacterium]
MPGAKILVVDDEPHIRELLKLYLSKEGYEVLEARDGEAALHHVAQAAPSLMILDIMMPRTDGWDVLRSIRQKSTVPVIMLTAKGEEVDRVLGLELGADDYITKPFSPRELVARVKAVLRRTTRVDQEPELLDYGHFRIDRSAHELRVGGEPVACPAKEFDLLWLLCANPNRTFTREQLLQKVWGYDFFGDARTVDVHVRRVREKIEPEPESPRYIITIWGVGYKFVEAG